MVRGLARVFSACMALMVSCVWQPMTAIELPSGDTSSMLTFLAIPRPETASLPLHLPDNDDLPYGGDFSSSRHLDAEDAFGDLSERSKRVFLSRGWGPGGYEAPQPPQRFVRRPPLPSIRLPHAQPMVQAQKDQGTGGSRFAALVSPQQQPPNQPSTQYRRFHSIFTSGTWSPLGKRGGSPPFPAESMETLSEDDAKEPPMSVVKKSAVFASHGWGAGGSSTPRNHPWASGTGSLRSMIYPVMSLNKGSWESSPSSGGDQRHVSSFKSVGATQQRKPLLHLFVSNGWGPMGR